MFSDWFGQPCGEVMGQGLALLGPQGEVLSELVARAEQAAVAGTFDPAHHTVVTKLHHKYVAPVEVHIQVHLAGGGMGWRWSIDWWHIDGWNGELNITLVNML